MKDKDKTREQLTEELEELRRRNAELEAIEAKHLGVEKALKQTEEEKRTILDSLVEHVILHDMEMRVQWANRAACDSVGMTREELIGRNCYELWAKRTETCEDCPVKLARQTGQPQGIEKTTPDGRSWYVRGSPVLDSNGHFVGMVELTLDITERKRAEEGLRQVHDELENRVEERTADLLRANAQLRQEIRERKQAEEQLGRYKLIVSAVQDPMSFIDSNYIYLTVNDAYTEIFERPREEIIGRSVAEMFGREIFEKQIKSYFDKCLTGEEIHYSDWLDFPDGKRRCMLISYYPFFENDKSVSGLVVRAHDMTDLELAQEALRESERTLNAILAASPMGIGLVRNRTLGWTNKALYRMWGYEEDSLLGQSTELIYPHAEEYERVGRDFYSEIEKWGFGQVETRWLTKDGRVIDCHLQGSPLDSSDMSKGVIVAAMDITERKQTEEQVRRLSQEVIKTQEVERKRLAADLHDRLAQDLASLKVGLDTLYGDKPDSPDERRQKVAELSLLLEHTLMAVRDKAYGLHPPSLKEFGLAYTVQEYCKEFSEKNSLKVDFFSVGMEDLELDFDTEIAFYRLVQEGLTNVRKHADASQVNVRLSASFSHIMLHIEDNGKGFEVKNRLAAALDERRMGIWSMKQRVAFLNGEMKIESDRINGTKILVKVPHLDKTNG
jgi:PAS domain S-box-containing protein